MGEDIIGAEGGDATAGLRRVILTPGTAQFVAVPSSPAKRSLEGLGEGTGGNELKKQALGEDLETEEEQQP